MVKTIDEITKLFTSLKDRSVRIFPRRIRAPAVEELITERAQDKAKKPSFLSALGIAGNFANAGVGFIGKTLAGIVHAGESVFSKPNQQVEKSSKKVKTGGGGPGARTILATQAKQRRPDPAVQKPKAPSDRFSLKDVFSKVGKLFQTKDKKGPRSPDQEPPPPVRKIAEVIKLPGIQSFDFKFLPQIAVLQGIRANFLQPWFEKPIEITLQGFLYIGSYTGQKSQPEIDDLLFALSELSKSIRNVGIKTTQVTEPPEGDQIDGGYTLLIGETGDDYSVQMNGYVSGVDYTERVEEPFLLSYTINFVGTSLSVEDILGAKRKANKSFLSKSIDTAQRPIGLLDSLRDKVSGVRSSGDALRNKFPGLLK